MCAASFIHAPEKCPPTSCPGPATYEVQYETEGDLNNDGFADRAVVLQNKADSAGIRPVLALLGQLDKSYRLDKVSGYAFPVAYNEVGFQLHDTEDLTIDNGELRIDLYSIGPSGNSTSIFKYFGRDLLLTYIETYNMGAGSHLRAEYDVFKGTLTEAETNTMKDDMPTEVREYRLKKKTFHFESADPKEIISQAFRQARDR